jgi:hypothetical protein
MLYIGCNKRVEYKFASNLLGTSNSSSTIINVFFDETGNYEFDDFTCEPKECCVFQYLVTKQLNSTIEADSSEI